MSANATADAALVAAGTKPKKNKKKGKKAGKPKTNGATADANGVKSAEEIGGQEEGEDEEPESPLPADDSEPTDVKDEDVLTELGTPLTSNGIPGEAAETASHRSTTGASAIDASSASGSTEARLAVAAKERDQLRAEVTELRKSLEGIQQQHEHEISGFKDQLQETHEGKDHAESQYRSLLGKVNTIKAQLGERLKTDAEELDRTRTRIEELEDQNRTVTEKAESLEAEVSKVQEDNKRQSQEISELRGRTNLSQQNWAKERDDLISREAYAREEFETAKQAMQDWEVLAMEERSIREGLSERVAELEEQLSNRTEAYNKAASERDTQASTVEGLQRALQDIQEARKQELREIVENSQSQVEELRTRLKASEEASSESQTALEKTRQELERALPFEKEVKEKNLLIGKLRHEAVILNDHLTKALRFLRKGKPEDNVDRQLVTNHLLPFLALDRSDPKKFQVLQLISALLGWSDEQREQAGLARPGTSTLSASSLRIPLSPFRRTSSTASLTADMSLQSPNSRESLAEAWSEFLEREAREGVSSPRQSVGSPTNSALPNPEPK